MHAARARDVRAEQGGEAVARQYASRFDQYDGALLLGEEDIAAASAQVSQKLKDDIAFAHDNVRRFAEKQRDTMQDVEMEIVPGLVAGQRLIPVSSAMYSVTLDVGEMSASEGSTIVTRRVPSASRGARRACGRRRETTVVP